MRFVLAIMTTRKTRADACLANTKTGDDCTDVAPCNTAPFGEGCDADIYEGAREAECRKDIKKRVVW